MNGTKNMLESGVKIVMASGIFRIADICHCFLGMLILSIQLLLHAFADKDPVQLASYTLRVFTSIILVGTIIKGIAALHTYYKKFGFSEFIRKFKVLGVIFSIVFSLLCVYILLFSGKKIPLKLQPFAISTAFLFCMIIDRILIEPDIRGDFIFIMSLVLLLISLLKHSPDLSDRFEYFHIAAGIFAMFHNIKTNSSHYLATGKITKKDTFGVNIVAAAILVLSIVPVVAQIDMTYLPKFMVGLFEQNKNPIDEKLLEKNENLSHDNPGDKDLSHDNPGDKDLSHENSDNENADSENTGKAEDG